MKKWIVRFILRHFAGWVEKHSAGDPKATWIDLKFEGWAKDNDEQVVVGRLIGKRSDGTHFYVVTGICYEDFDIASLMTCTPNMAKQSLLELNQAQLRLSLDRFLHCRCLVRKPCLKHRLGAF